MVRVRVGVNVGVKVEVHSLTGLLWASMLGVTGPSQSCSLMTCVSYRCRRPSSCALTFDPTNQQIIGLKEFLLASLAGWGVQLWSS